MQKDGLAAPVAADAFPAAQLRQTDERVAEVAVENLPATQAMHDVAPEPFWYIPPGQRVQLATVEAEYVPEGHLSQLSAPRPTLYLPASHMVHVAAPNDEY